MSGLKNQNENEQPTGLMKKMPVHWLSKPYSASTNLQAPTIAISNCYLQWK